MFTFIASEPHSQGFHQAKDTLQVNQEYATPLQWKAMPIPDKTVEEKKIKKKPTKC